MPSRGSRTRMAASALTVLLALGATPAEGFGTVKQRHQQRVLTRRHFKQDGLKTEDVVDSSAFLPQVDRMPTWLRHSRGHQTEDNLSSLREAMVKSFFTEHETSRLFFAIEEAAKGDRNKMAGAADFCLILVDTMEMGLNALIAAAFHYCSCVSARERSLLLPPGVSASSVWKGTEEHPGLPRFGEHAVRIASDAAQLKKLEMVAASVTQSPASSARVSPDANDSQNLQRLLLTETEDWRALAIRSAACLFRLRGLLESNSKKLSPEAVRVGREALYMFAPLASRLGMHRLKNELEDAAFALLYRRQYETVTALSRQIRQGKKVDPNMSRRTLINNNDEQCASTVGESMRNVLDDVTEEVREMLRHDPVFSRVVERVRVMARVKEPFSMWRKMLNYHATDILEVPDALALRVVLDAKKLAPDEDAEVTRARERALCYYVQKLCTERWQPLPGNSRFKDYIGSPKPNGYQSLHYTAQTYSGGEDWKVEFQIRSGEMHKVAEYGLASHWDYKAQSNKKAGQSSQPQPTDSYLRSVKEWHWQQHAGSSAWDTSLASSELMTLSDTIESKLRAERIRARTTRLAPYIEALSVAQTDLAREHVFVFLSHSHDTVNSEGKVLALPAGACVVDALREGEKALGLRLNWRGEHSFVSHNGSRANATQRLKNGDILTVPLAGTQLTHQ